MSTLYFGGNGVAERIIEEVSKLPIKPRFIHYSYTK